MDLLLLATFGEVVSYVGYILIAILILLVMITVHEFGHYITGKIFKFGIDEFAIGFGPKLFSKTKKDGEVFSLRALPIGGFCAFRGEDQDSDDPTAFNNKKPWQRLIVLVSGALMNYITALLIIMLMFGIYGHTALVAYKLDSASSGETGSFYERDVIIKAEDKNVYLITDLMSAIDGKEKGDVVQFTVLRKGEKQKIDFVLKGDTHFTSVEDNVRLYTALGLAFETDANGALINGGLYSTGVRFGFFETIGRSFEYSFKLAGTIFKILGQLITGTLGLSSIGGTVTTVAVTADAIKIGGFRNLLNISSLIGVNLAVFNLLPFPALDGSRAVFTGLEWIRKKPINRRVEGIIHTVGLFLILIFAVFIDLQQCF